LKNINLQPLTLERRLKEIIKFCKQLQLTDEDIIALQMQGRGNRNG